MDDILQFLDPNGTLVDTFLGGLATLLKAVGLLLVGWIIARTLRNVIKKVLVGIKLDFIAEKINFSELTNKFGVKIKPSDLLAKITYFIVFLVFFIATTNMLQLTIVSEKLSAMIDFFPKLFVSLMIILLGTYLADALKKSVYTSANSIGISGAKVISNIVFYVLMIFVIITALDQAGMDTTLITSNIIIILASAFLAFALAYSFAARDVLKNIISSFYGRDRFNEGQVIRVNGVQGRIIKIDSISVTLQAEDRKIVLPSNTLISEQIEILEDVEE